MQNQGNNIFSTRYAISVQNETLTFRICERESAIRYAIDNGFIFKYIQGL